MTAPPPRPRPTNLPDYSDPPVDEVVIGISFMSVSGFSTNHVAKYRDLVKAEFPGLQYQPRLITPLESLTQEGSSAPPSFGHLGFFTQPFAQPSQRTWLVNADDQRVIQIQDDAFLTNWRRRDLKPYPHFEPLLGEFWERFSLFRDQVVNDTVIRLQAQQLEVTYINWVPFDTAPLSSWFGPAESSRLAVDGTGILPEHVTWNASYLVRRNDVAVARMHCRQIEALRTGPGAPHLGVQLDLTCRAPLAPGATDDEINDLAFEARNTIVWGFTSLTTEEGHRNWGRTK